MTFLHKYLKYKNKYLKYLKNNNLTLIGGMKEGDKYEDTIFYKTLLNMFNTGDHIGEDDRPPNPEQHITKIRDAINSLFEKSILNVEENPANINCVFQYNNFLCLFIKELTAFLNKNKLLYLLSIKGGRIYNLYYDSINPNLKEVIDELFKINNSPLNSDTITTKTDIDFELIINTELQNEFNKELISFFMDFVKKHSNNKILNELFANVLAHSDVTTLLTNDQDHTYDILPPDNGTFHIITKGNESSMSTLGLNAMAKQDDYTYSKIFTIVYNYTIQQTNKKTNQVEKVRRYIKFIDISIIDRLNSWNHEIINKSFSATDLLYTKQYTSLSKGLGKIATPVAIYTNTYYNAIFNQLYTLMFQHRGYYNNIKYAPWKNKKFLKKIGRLIFTFIIAIPDEIANIYMYEHAHLIYNAIQSFRNTSTENDIIILFYPEVAAHIEIMEHSKRCSYFTSMFNNIGKELFLSLFDIYTNRFDIIEFFHIFLRYIFHLSGYTLILDQSGFEECHTLLTNIDNIFRKLYELSQQSQATQDQPCNDFLSSPPLVFQ